jgi:GH25 family lysozyme M1 (1,4-beta-N-acetylmuramidase)
MELEKYLKKKISSLNVDQKSLFDQMKNDNLLQICIPTGAGKGYLMMVDLLNQIISNDSKIFAISTHRLMLNSQHLNDIFGMLSNMIGDIGYIFVGSSKFDVNKYQERTEFNKKLLERGLSYNELVQSTPSMDEVDSLVSDHLSKGRKVVILTTYHSLNTLKNLDIDTIYNDEAHTLASESETAQFKDNFNQIKFKRCFFFTATPKDCNEDTESFLMNNEDVFGKRIGLTFNECKNKGYIVNPVIHIAMPSNFTTDVDFKSIDNMAKFVADTFIAHSEFIKEKSIDSDKIAPKILIKCPSVDDMWKIHSKLVGTIDGVKICAGASRNDNSNFNHFIDNVGVSDRSQYLEILQNLSDNESAIVLHYDTMSEGINVAGFTGTEFLGGKLPTITKTLQNTGRSTRLHREDRDRLVKGEISVGDGNWIKPHCAVIIPYWDKESEFTTKELARQIKSLRDNFGYDPIYYVSIGSDLGNSKKEDEIDALNKKDDKKKKSELIEEINHEIEVLDKEEIDLKELERINNMSIEEWFKFANDL